MEAARRSDGSPVSDPSGLKWDDDAVASLAAFWPEFREAEDLGIKFPHGAIIGSVRLIGCLSKSSDQNTFGFAGSLCFGRTDTLAMRDDPFFFGPFGWVLEDVEAFEHPIECRGFQKLWTPKPATRVALQQAQVVKS